MYNISEMEKVIHDSNGPRNCWLHGGPNKAILGLGAWDHGNALNSSTSTSPDSANLSSGPLDGGLTTRLQHSSSCYDGWGSMDKSYNRGRHSRFNRASTVDYENVVVENKAVKRSSRPYIGTVVSLANSVISCARRSDGNRLVPTSYDGSSDSLASKHSEDEIGKVNMMDGPSCTSSNDEFSDSTFSNGHQSEDGVDNLIGIQLRLDDIRSSGFPGSNTLKNSISCDLLDLVSNDWSHAETCEVRYAQEFPALPGQVDVLLEASGSTYSGNHLLISKHLKPTSRWSCMEIHTLLQTTASILMSTEDALNTVVERITPSKSCREKKKYLFRVMERFLIQCLGKGTKVYMTGSTAYDIDLDYSRSSIPSYSDIDIEVITPRYGSNSRAILRKVYTDLCEMQSTLKEVGLVNNWVIGNSVFKLVDSARVPIVFMKTQSGIRCDISTNAVNSLSHNELFKSYIQKHPILRNIMRLIKHWLKYRGIPIMKEGGFPTILWMLLFCNVVDTDDASAASNKGPKTMVSSISEMLKSRNMLNGSVRCTATVEKEERSSYPNILASLEQCFRTLSHGRNLIEMIDCVTSCKSAQDHTKHRDGARLSMGKICRDLIHLIEMEPNVPYATWLVYYYELYRAEEHMVQYTMYMEILVSLIVCLRVHAAFTTSGDLVSTMRQLQALIDNIKELYGYDLLHLVQDGKSVMDNIETYVRSTADRLGIRLDCTQMMDDVRMLINNVIQKFSGIALNMFHDAYDKVYTIPTAIEPPAPIPVSSEKQEGKSQWPSTPMIEGTMWNDSGWFIVSLSCELYIVKVIKICVDWESWWSMDFVSRRDCKTVFHGFVYRQVTVDTEDDHEEADELPCVLLRKGGLVLFHPCDIVSRLYVIKVMRHEHTISSRYYSFDMFTGARTLYVMPGFEVKRYTQFRRTAARLSKYLNPSMILKSPVPQGCCHCGAITVSRVYLASDYKTSPRKLRNLRYILCCKRYVESYRRMQAGLKRGRQNIQNSYI
ncbi:hypothetical protein X943_003559 [Babesia divergens]|uniref:Poly(A) RNA polymerase mitochondrial-like central palm domain-containing protein n=1 Tax=Babesia divergens TaxID=32595 RepID=A0AAD9LFY4_BABDI|nr:hypothetical protein X943_003559 [Babesia divergens]